ncbi:BREX-1 system phosphatase PglZ type A [Armatimonas sp.]|uniref:BREX-1 system phosphatase PglZ type A n=1 Tax=Armatimonas sp. TaxID=1872638 RepID=UPI003753A653
MSASETSGVLPLFTGADADTPRVLQGLRYQFENERHRIVFWNDPDEEFTEAVGTLSLDGVTLLRLDQTPALAVKIRLERNDKVGRYLIYAPFAEPAPEEDWLLDIRLYSGIFRADRASMQLAELGLGQNQSLREHLRKRNKFLASKDRLARLGRLVQSTDDATLLDRKMLAVLTRADQAEPFALVSALFHDLASQPDGLSAVPTQWEEITRYGLDVPFWEMVQQTFGYSGEPPRLRNLLIRLLVTDFSQSLSGTLPAALAHHVLPEGTRANVVVFLNQWRDSASRGNSYDHLSERVAESLSLSDHLGELTASALARVYTFLTLEKRIASELRDRIVHALQQGTKGIEDLAARRQNGHWASPNLPETAEIPRRAFHALYTALMAATELQELLTRYANGFSFATAREFYRAYERDLYRFDQLYRHFCAAAQLAQAAGWDILKPLEDSVESRYLQGFLTPLSVAWGACLETLLKEGWTLDEVDNQNRFYERRVKPILDKGEVKRVFVIVSDAFRYEAARELAAELNGRFRFRAELSSQLGVLPSYTALGMASLLPHSTLEYNSKGDVLADGKTTVGIENRKKILAGVGGVAISSDEILAMKKDEGRAAIRDHRVVYLYHNTVDAIGDSASTEEETFSAVARAIEELANLVRHVINGLNGSYVIVTADHGFLYQSSALTLTDKSQLGDRPTGMVIAKKRYLIGTGLSPQDHVYHGETEATSGATGMEFWLPKGTSRFHFTGGARFVHGGAMLQEIVVPVITVRELEGAAAATTKTRPVAVHVLGNNIKVTTNRHRIQLIQTEAVTERIKPVTLSVALYDGARAITNVETLTFDSTSSEMPERIKSVLLTLKSQSYDRKKPYHLILRGVEDSIEYQRVDVTIDQAFENDF